MSVEQLRAALDGLQNDATNREKYNRWLQDFQRSPQAWQTSHDVLSAPGDRALKIFSAQTLRHKIARDLHQVPRDMRIELKEQVLSLLEQNLDLVNVVGVQLCVALAAFAVQVPEWDHPVHELISKFDSQATVPLLFEFLRVLPEEFDSSRPSLVDPVIRLERAKELVADNALMILNFMLNRAQYVDDNRALFFETLKPWLSEISLEQIVASPFVEAMFQQLDDDGAREAAADCICSVIHEADEVREQSVQEAVKVLYPHVIELPKRFAARYADDPEVHRDITRILSQAGEDWHVLVCSEPTTFLPLVEAIAQCIMVPDANLEVVEFTFTFLERVRMLVGATNTHVYAGAPAVLKPIFTQLISAFLRYLEHPAVFASPEEKEKFRDFRYIIGDVLKACCVVAGDEAALGVCAAKLRELLEFAASENGSRSATPAQSSAPPESRWRAAEAVLFSIRVMARVVPLTNSVMPDIFGLLRHLPQDVDQVQHAAVMLIGRFSDWTAGHPDFVPFSLEFIVRAIESPFEETKRGGAHALLYFCQDCAIYLRPFLSQMIEFYHQLAVRPAPTQPRIDRESLSKVTDGIGSVLMNLQQGEMPPYLDALFNPAIERLSLVVSHPDQIEAAGDELHALASLVATLQTQGTITEEHPLTVIVLKHHQAVMQLLQTFASNKDTVDAIGQYYTQVLFNLGRPFAVGCGIERFSEFLASVSSVLQTYPVYGSLYHLSSVVAREINPVEHDMPDQQYFEQVLGFCETVSNVLFASASQITRGGEHLEVLRKGFNHLNSLLVGYTTKFAQSTILESSVALAVHVYNEHDDYGVLEAASFFVIDLGTFCSEVPPSETKDKIVSVFDAHGQELLHALIKWFLYRYDPELNSIAENTISMVCRASPALVLDWLKASLDSLPEGSLSEEEKFEFTGRVFQTLAVQRFDVIGRLINEFADAWCARNSAPR